MVPVYPHIFRKKTRTFQPVTRAVAAALIVAFAVPFGAAHGQMTGVVQNQTQGPVQSTAGVASGYAAPMQEYRIGPGDELSVTFPYNAELNHDGQVGPDGRFSLPLLGSLPLAGDTLTQATSLITNALRDGGIVENAYPSVTVQRYGTAVYVGGEVKTPGMVQLSAGMDALQAVMVAGGLLDTAKTGHVAIIRHTADLQPKITYFDLHGYTRGSASAKVAMLEPRDVIFVPKSKIAEVDLWIDEYLNKTVPFSKGINYTFGNYPAAVVAK